jgi:hypothetical protein
LVSTWATARWDVARWDGSEPVIILPIPPAGTLLVGTIFDDLVADLEKTPSERFARVGFGQPGFTTECRLLINEVREFEK